VKKLFASLLLLALTVGISAPSFAQDTPKKDDTATTSKAKGKKKGEAKADAMKTDAKTDEKTATKGKAKGKTKTDKETKEAPPKA
jgi:hypothetical protein